MSARQVNQRMGPAANKDKLPVEDRLAWLQGDHMRGRLDQAKTDGSTPGPTLQSSGGPGAQSAPALAGPSAANSDRRPPISDAFPSPAPQLGGGGPSTGIG